MKIGIMTLYRNYNYGAVLQAYALQSFIKKNWPNCETIKYYREINGKAKKPRSFFINSTLNIFRSMRMNKSIDAITYLRIQKKINSRNLMFNEFISNNISESRKEYIGHKNLKELNTIYDVFVAGSDNIWNKNLLDTAFFLDFADDDKGKISYAAGMSYDSADSSIVDVIKPLLSRLDYISTREPSGKKLIESITNKTVFRALDPTLLLQSEEWSQIEKTINIESDMGYILCFFIEPSELMFKEAKLLREETGKTIVCLPLLHQKICPGEMEYADICLFNVGPQELLSLVRQADFICTDSFHGTAFSIIYNRQFACFRRFKDEKRSSLNLRMDHLLDSLGIPDRIVEVEDDIRKIYKKHIEYTQINECLETLRNESIDFLCNGINSLDRV